jgi:hypothetical protein
MTHHPPVNEQYENASRLLCLVGTWLEDVEAEKKDTPDASYDAPLCEFALHDVAVDERVSMVAQWARVVHPAGKLFVREHLSMHGIHLHDLHPFIGWGMARGRLEHRQPATAWANLRGDVHTLNYLDDDSVRMISRSVTLVARPRKSRMMSKYLPGVTP